MAYGLHDSDIATVLGRARAPDLGSNFPVCLQTCHLRRQYRLQLHSLGQCAASARALGAVLTNPYSHM